MKERPLSDRTQHLPSGLCWELRAWAEPPGNVPDERGCHEALLGRCGTT